MVKSKNPKIDKSKKENHVANWEIGEKIGCHENTVLRMFRHTLTEEQTAFILSAIDEIVIEREQ